MYACITPYLCRTACAAPAGIPGKPSAVAGTVKGRNPFHKQRVRLPLCDLPYKRSYRFSSRDTPVFRYYHCSAHEFIRNAKATVQTLHYTKRRQPVTPYGTHLYGISPNVRYPESYVTIFPHSE